MKLLAGVDPKSTLVTTELPFASSKFVPVIVTDVPPTVVPVVVPKLETVGADPDEFHATTRVKFVALYCKRKRFVPDPNTSPVTL